MAASTIQVGSSYRLRLSACDFARKLVFGNDWTKVRIAFTYGIDYAASFTNKIAIGLCNGTDETYQSASCTDFIGIEIPSATWTYQAFPTPKYSDGYTSICDGIRKVGSTITRVAGSASTGVYWNSNINVAFPAVLEIERTFPSYNFTLLYDGNPGTAYPDYSRYDFTVNMGSEEYVYYSTYLRTLSVGGPVYDTVNIHWDAAFPCLNIKELTVLRFH